MSFLSDLGDTFNDALDTASDLAAQKWVADNLPERDQGVPPDNTDPAVYQDQLAQRLEQGERNMWLIAGATALTVVLAVSVFSK